MKSSITKKEFEDLKYYFLQNHEFEARTSKGFFRDKIYPAISQKTLIDKGYKKSQLKKLIQEGFIEECFYAPDGQQHRKGYLWRKKTLKQETKFKRLIEKICTVFR